MEYQLEFHTPDDSGYSLADKYGDAIPEEPEIEPGSEHYLEWFNTLSSRRGHSMNGALPISYAEIDAWARLTGTLIRPEDVQCLVAMDSAYLSTLSKMREARESKPDKTKPK